MRARNREINIFNMSLLDILCGALGAFCFMMIVLLPYYKPGNPEDSKHQEEINRTFEEIKKVVENLQDPELAKKLAELIEKLKAQIKELEGRVNSLTEENKQLQGQVNDLMAKNKQLKEENQSLDKQIRQLSVREPFVIFSKVGKGSFAPAETGFLYLFVWDAFIPKGGVKQPPFDPKKPGAPYWPEDQEFHISGLDPSATWMVRDVTMNDTFKIYVVLEVQAPEPADPKKLHPVPLTKSFELLNLMTSSAGMKVLPAVTLTPEHPWTLIGFINSDKVDNKKLNFREATAAEREAEWRALDKK